MKAKEQKEGVMRHPGNARDGVDSAGGHDISFGPAPDIADRDREAILAEFEADEQHTADLLADEEAEAQRFDDLNRHEPRWAFLP